MEWLDGRVFHEFATPGVAPQERTELYRSMCATLAEIHKISRWARLWTEYRKGDDDNPALDRIVAWLEERVPESETLALCHGDFRIANVMFHAREPRVIGVLDWELSTLGHPLVDLAFNSQAWRMAPNENGGLLGLPLKEMGIPAEQDHLDLYYRLAGSTERLTRFHQVFAMFRGAVGSAGVAVRGEIGNNTLPDAARIGRHLSRAYAARGAALIEEQP
jgi:aminoglycoside phosphotransferase (APT) family kinase protein